MSKERIQKILARAGLGSRRACESLITEGVVRVNGRVVDVLGSTADPFADKIEVRGKRVVLEKPAYYIFHKPRAVVSTLKDPEGRESLDKVVSKLPERVFPVGRLDYHTSGALLLTNDGNLSESLLRPGKKVPKVYAVKFRGILTIPELDQLRNGVVLDDGYKTRPCELFILHEDGGNSWLQVTLTEGKNRQIRRMGEAIGRRVQRLARTSFADVSTEGLAPGEIRPLHAKELERLEKKYLKGAKQASAEENEGPPGS